MFEIVLPDGSRKAFDRPVSALEVAQSIGPRLASDTVGVRVNGSKEILDLRDLLRSGDRIELITIKSPLAIEVARHSAAHIMAEAVQSIWPEVKVTIGPVIETGFYYDFDSPRSFVEEDFPAIEAKMSEIVKRKSEIRREIWPVAKAIQQFRSMGETFKVELIEELAKRGETEVSIYFQGEWFDLCRGPHLQNTNQLKAFKLLSVAGAYWRGDERNKMLQRIYATAFMDSAALEQYLHQVEEAKRRDHRRIGKDMDLFHFHRFAPASPFFSAPGATIYNQLVQYMRELYDRYGYQEVITPQIFDSELFRISGHAEHYKDSMYFTQIDERQFGLKPMNCPSHCLLFGMHKHSYKELPLRIADFGRLHRFEKSGAVHGLTRVRTFCQDDAHIFCSLDQLENEIVNYMNLVKEVYAKLGMPEPKIFLSTRPESRMGSDEVWDRAEGALKAALEHMGIPYAINAGDGAFYGPKLDFMFVDAIGRSWQLTTLQLDFNLPEQFDLNYVGDDNKEHRPVMLHRAVLGSLERFIGVYTEHVAGHFPLWLAPEQLRILTITEKADSWAESIYQSLRVLGVRCNLDLQNEPLKAKVRKAQIAGVPLMIIVGEKEAASGVLSLRYRSGQTESGVNLNEFQKQLKNHIVNRNFTPFNFGQEVGHSSTI